MKKLIYSFLLLAAVLLTACGKDDEPVSKQTFNLTINNRAVNGNNVVFSQGTARVEIDYTNMTIRFSNSYKDAEEESHTLNTNLMKLTVKSNSIYGFSGDGIVGYFDLATGVMWYAFNENMSRVVGSTHLLYAYSTTTVTDPDHDNNHFDHQKSAYIFAFDDKGEHCAMQIYNFVPNTSGSIEASEIVFRGLNATPTVDGYTITADKVEPTTGGSNTITDLKFDITTDGHIINGSFKCRGLEFKVKGQLFPNIGL